VPNSLRVNYIRSKMAVAQTLLIMLMMYAAYSPLASPDKECVDHDVDVCRMVTYKTTCVNDDIRKACPKTCGVCDCYVGHDVEYTGDVSRTVHGVECQRWDVNTPHIGLPFFANPDNHPDGNIHHNHCRTIGANSWDKPPWCYTMDPNRLTEFCNISRCEDYLCQRNPQSTDYPCHLEAYCTDIKDPSSCQCNAGYEGDGKTCYKCVCHRNAHCTDPNDPSSCQCNEGYTGDGSQHYGCVAEDFEDTEETAWYEVKQVVLYSKSSFKGEGSQLITIPTKYRISIFDPRIHRDDRIPKLWRGCAEACYSRDECVAWNYSLRLRRNSKLEKYLRYYIYCAIFQTTANGKLIRVLDNHDKIKMRVQSGLRPGLKSLPKEALCYKKDKDCGTENSMCIPFKQGDISQYGKCKCVEGFVRGPYSYSYSYSYSCVAQNTLSLGEKCTELKKPCMDPNSRCRITAYKYGRCECKLGFASTESSSKCSALTTLELGQRCHKWNIGKPCKTDNSECKIPSTVGNGKRPSCQCKTGFHLGYPYVKPYTCEANMV